jgi:hypothetical protein
VLEIDVRTGVRQRSTYEERPRVTFGVYSSIPGARYRGTSKCETEECEQGVYHDEGYHRP